MDDNKQEIAILVEKVQQGDMDAFGKLYELVSPRSLFVALEIVKNKQDAEDILQDSFITALEKINTVEKSESFVGWFNRIVANKSKDFLKKKKPVLFDEEEKQVFELIPDEDREYSPQENFNDNETRQLVLDAVNELSDEKRICILLHYYNEMSVADIAKSVGANENTIKSRLFQARKDLSAKFKELERKGLYGFSPIGLVLWAWRNTEGSVAEGFIGSETASTILASVTANAGTGAATVATTVSAAATAGTTAAASSTAVVGASSTAAASTGIAAKIAALTVAQKVVAGVTVAGIVTTSAAGTATVIKNNAADKTEESTTTVIYAVGDKVVTASDWLETNTVTETSTSEESTETAVVVSQLITKTTDKKTEEPSCTVAPTTKKAEENKTETQRPSQTEKKTKRTTTRRDYSLNKSTETQTIATTTAKPTTTKKKRTTTTEEATTTKSTTTKRATTTETEPETTRKKETTTKKVTTTKQTTTTTMPTTTTTKPTTTEATTKGKAKVIIAVYNLNAENNTVPIAQETFEVDAGTLIDNDFVFSKLTSGIGGVSCSEDDVFTIDIPSSGHEMKVNESYSIKVNCLL